jgi:hypothetical protein
MMQAKCCDPSYSDDKSLLVWDDERAAKFATSETKKGTQKRTSREKWFVRKNS